MSTRAEAPGAYTPCVDRWARFDALAEGLPSGALCVVDERVAALHPHVLASLSARSPLDVVHLKAHERIKGLRTLEELCGRAHLLPRSGTLVCVGGGTLGDLCTVAAHLIKRGVRLIQVPTTLLAAVDSSLGGKGAVHARSGGHTVKNALGAFHYAAEAWLCEELLATLEPAQRREGAVEAWKKFICLDPARVASFRTHPPTERALVESARALKESVCARDPYDLLGTRRVLNFGHTFGHAVESVTHFRVRHGEAVGLGILCALDVGRAVGITSEPLAADVENLLEDVAGVKRRGLRSALGKASADDVAGVVAADKKGADAGGVTMVLLRALGSTEARRVTRAEWEPLLSAWSEGRRP